MIPTDKLVRHALDPDHPRGRHKARVFAAALGIGQSDWRHLHDVVVLIDGLNGATQPVATIWLVAGDRPPRLVTAWVDIP